MFRRIQTALLVGFLWMMTTGVHAQPGNNGHNQGGAIDKMGRLRTVGFEGNVTSSKSIDGTISATGGTFTISGTNARSGSTAAKCSQTNIGGVSSIALASLAGGEVQAVPADLFVRCYFYFENLPTSTATIMAIGSVGVNLRLTSGGVLRVFNTGNTTQFGSDSSVTLTTNQWYRIEMNFHVATGSTDTVEVRVDGVSAISATGLSVTDTSPTTISMGWVTTPGANGATLWLDDAAVNNGAGSFQTSWPGDGKIVLLLPTTDNSVGTGWADGDGAGTLAHSVDNNPPIGAVTPADGTQITNATSTTTGNYDVNIATYISSGIDTIDPITVVQAICDHAEEVSTATKNGALQIVSNPAQGSEDSFVFGNDAGAMGAWPTNWFTSWGTAQSGAFVDPLTGPVLRVGKRTATTRVVDVDFMGLYVEYTLGVARLAMIGVGH